MGRNREAVPGSGPGWPAVAAAMVAGYAVHACASRAGVRGPGSRAEPAGTRLSGVPGTPLWRNAEHASSSFAQQSQQAVRAADAAMCSGVADARPSEND
ncbi:hypothetical protein ncot_13875 [Nocardioides sp. JQ2195]|uniref:hypothetical protein n=1 Tax=Nocardioides sp. JQ2195 TaxID=2592334 RepID=UPI00143EBFC5|nr:hypothetical protein [Nocardioides sp. JQ2195]QIX27569.1 hypothetical protein ncot_13875 [Nocardioides sp. JQ2195]